MASSSSLRLDCEITVPLTLAAGVTLAPQAESPSAAAMSPAATGKRILLIRSGDASGPDPSASSHGLGRHQLHEQVVEERRLVGVPGERHHQLADVLLV